MIAQTVLHETSLLHLAPVRLMLEDPHLHLLPRGVDNQWFYRRLLGRPMTGFNPFAGQVFYAAESCFSHWLQQPEGPTRDVNEGDFLMFETFSAVHDYLHCWAVRAVNQLRPELGLGYAPITDANFEDLAFAYLLTETAATMIDYWYLATMDLNDVVDVGTAFRCLSTSGYHEDNLAEYRRFLPSWDAQTPQWMYDLHQFYCSGVFPGFSRDALARSPKMLAWLRHELSYGGLQRVYTRQWLSFLSEGRVSCNQARLEAPLEMDTTWKQDLAADVALALWDLMHQGKDPITLPATPPEATWTSPRREADFRFHTADAVRDLPIIDSAENRTLYRNQLLSRRALRDLPEPLVSLCLTLGSQMTPAQLAWLLRDQAPLPDPHASADLLYLG